MRRRAGRLAERAALASARMGVVAPMLPLPLYDAYFAAMASRALVAACSTGVAEALPGEPGEVAARLDLDPLGVDVLLRALESLGYVRARRGRYRLTRAGRWLRSDRLGPVVGGFVPHAWETLTHLEPALRREGVGGLHERPADDPFWAQYQGTMARLDELFGAQPFAAAVPAGSPRHLLDLAGGPGTHAAALMSRFPGLRATVVELPAAAAHGRDDVEYLVGDLFEVELPTADLVTANAVLHTLPRERGVELLRRARGALEPGGLFASLNVDYPERGRPGPLAAGLLSLVFYASAGARALTERELREMAREAGLRDLEVKRPARLPGSLVLLARP